MLKFLQEFQCFNVSNLLGYRACQIVPHEIPSSIKQSKYQHAINIVTVSSDT